MNSEIKIVQVIIVLALFFTSILFPVIGRDRAEKIYMAIEFNNVVCGYSEFSLSDSVLNGKKLDVIEQSTYANFFALGKDITQYQKFSYIIDSPSGNFVYHDSFHKQGNMELGGKIFVEENTLRIVSSNGEENILPIPSNQAILPNTLFFKYLLDDFNTNNLKEKTYQVYSFKTGNFSQISYTKVEEKEVELGNAKYMALILEESNLNTGLKSNLWIDKNSGIRLKVEYPNQMSMYLTDRSVQSKIKTGNWDEVLFVKTNVSIEDIHQISYMKVKGRLDAYPAVKIKDLNVPGQIFSGSIEGDKIAGVFEISHNNFSGKDAPAFPFDIHRYNFPEIYLQKEDLIEADDPSIILAAKKITEGYDNLWEACCKLSEWVADNVDGSILDGSALDTFKSKKGLCGGQSRLMAALCRSVGIPARVVWGFLYTPEYGGSFGHHAWNEIFMGEKGWIPVDVTIHEIDYVNSGHIRLGILHTHQTIINFEEMETIEFEVKNSQ